MGEVSQIENLNLRRIESKLDNLVNANIEANEQINRQIQSINGSLNEVSEEVRSLMAQFNKAMNEQKKMVALQQATTELIRIRQEIEQNFSNYKVVRETMLGVLQATDVALVKKTTISRVSEELMLSTPKYWLAPCLVAISAWIGNDKDLAERAIAEACKRDEERTALTMALICRRNNKIQTCYEWLAIYFAKQDAANFSEGSFTYINAYVNGVFGPDDKHMCDDYITKWINEIKGSNDSFEVGQEEMWKDYLNKFSVPMDERYPELKCNVQEYDKINAYMSRIQSVDTIKHNFDSIVNAVVDQERLKTLIDQNLITLVSRYDSEEEPLRKEEAYLKKVKYYGGDAEMAKKVIQEEEKKRQEKTLNLIEQMSRVIKSDENVSLSEKKTAVSFLSGYIKRGYNRFITEKKEEFPESITMNVNGWVGTTFDGTNYEQLCQDYDNYMANRYQKEIVNNNVNKPQQWKIAAIVLSVVSVIGFIAIPVLGVIGLIAAIYSWVKLSKVKKDSDKRTNEINEKYKQMGEDGRRRIADCINQWNEARSAAEQFNREPLKEIIA